MFERVETLYWSTFVVSRSWYHTFFDGFMSPDFRVWPEDSEGVPNVYFWSSHHLDDVASVAELRDRITALKAIFDGAMLLTYGSDYNPISLREVEADQTAPVKIGRLDVSGNVSVEPFSTAGLASKVSSYRNPIGKPVAESLFLARYDPVAKDILKYVGHNGLNYMTLYAFTDWMRQSSWDAARISSEAGWSNTKYGQFTQTANNPAFLGPFCRHGGSSSLPSKPMPLQDAIDPLRKATLAFLVERATNIDLAAKWGALTT